MGGTLHHTLPFGLRAVTLSTTGHYHTSLAVSTSKHTRIGRLALTDHPGCPGGSGLEMGSVLPELSRPPEAFLRACPPTLNISLCPLKFCAPIFAYRDTNKMAAELATGRWPGIGLLAVVASGGGARSDHSNAGFAWGVGCATEQTPTKRAEVRLRCSLL